MIQLFKHTYSFFQEQAIQSQPQITTFLLSHKEHIHPLTVINTAFNPRSPATTTPPCL